MAEGLEAIERYWDRDSATYDDSPDHGMASPAERAAWTAALARHLPPGARVLDVGAGTGFLSLAAARLGHQVTALDLSGGMLARLRASAERQGLSLDVQQGPAEAPPKGPFDVVVERHLLWTLLDPGTALAAWREACPHGRLVLFEGMWGDADPGERLRRRARGAVDALRGAAAAHHAPYEAGLRARLPLAQGMHPDRLVGLVEASPWGPARLERLRDVEWARLLSRPPLERLLGVTPQFVVTAG